MAFWTAITVHFALFGVSLPLFEAYPELQKIFHMKLGIYPTPLLDKTKEIGTA